MHNAIVESGYTIVVHIYTVVQLHCAVLTTFITGKLLIRSVITCLYGFSVQASTLYNKSFYVSQLISILLCIV